MIAGHLSEQALAHIPFSVRENLFFSRHHKTNRLTIQFSIKIMTIISNSLTAFSVKRLATFIRKI
jgi:hypothetical protein